MLLVIRQKQRNEIMKEFFIHVKSVFIILQNLHSFLQGHIAWKDNAEP